MTVHEIIKMVKERGASLAAPVEVEGMPPMTFECSISDQAASQTDLSALPFECPEELRLFWMEVSTARLFEDTEYGQWGLEILEPTRAVEVTERFRKERQQDSKYGDLVVGQFMGDSDLLIVRCDPTAIDFGAVMIALPLDTRDDWDIVGDSLGDFLQKYVTSGGDKYWSTT